MDWTEPGEVLIDFSRLCASNDPALKNGAPARRRGMSAL